MVEDNHGRCLECGATFQRPFDGHVFLCNDCQRAGEDGAQFVHADLADPVLLQNLQDMGFKERDARTALEQTNNCNLEAAIEFISNKIKGLRSTGQTGTLPAASACGFALDADILSAILLRMVATCSAEQLSRCAGVCQMWYVEAATDELWGKLLLRRWGEAAHAILGSLLQDSREASMSYRAQYVRSVTSSVLSWGQGARRMEDVGSAPRSPALLADGLIGIGIRQVSAGLCFSCAVSSLPSRSRRPVSFKQKHAHVHTPAVTTTRRSIQLQLNVALRQAIFSHEDPLFYHSACTHRSHLHTGVLTRQVTWNGKVLCWGVNSQGQCGVAPTGAAYVADALQLNLGERLALQVSCGQEYAACVTACGAVLCWGSNTMDQLGQTRGAATPLMESAPENDFSHEAVRPWLRRRGFGVKRLRGQMPQHSSRHAPFFTAIACGHSHNAALTRDGSVFTWGNNAAGQCGPASSVNDCAIPAAVDIKSLACRVSRVAAGADFTLLVTDDGVLSMGSNAVGQALLNMCMRICVHTDVCLCTHVYTYCICAHTYVW